MFHLNDSIRSSASVEGRYWRVVAVGASALVVALALNVPAGRADTTSTTSTTLPVEPAEPAVWPYASSSVRYHDPVDAARGFAVDFAGFNDPVLGEFQQGDTRSGEVVVRPNAMATVTTTVFVRQLGADDSWWVLGSASSTIDVTSPRIEDRVSSPLTVTGQASAFEGTVNIEVRQDGSTAALGSGIGTGSGSDQPGPFTTSVTFSPPTQAWGALIVREPSAEDGTTVTAAVLRLHFATPPASTTTTTTPTVTATPRYTG